MVYSTACLIVIIILWLHRHASKSLPFLPGTPRQVTSPPGSSKVSSAQARPPSPGNIRPVKKEAKPEGEKNRPEKEAEKANEERTEESKGTSAGARESASQEEPTVQAELAQGKERPSFRHFLTQRSHVLPSLSLKQCIFW